MKHIRYDLPVTGDALRLGARLPRRDELPTPASAATKVSPGVFTAPDGKMFTALEVPKGRSPEDVALERAADHDFYRDVVSQLRASCIHEEVSRWFDHKHLISNVSSASSAAPAPTPAAYEEARRRLEDLIDKLGPRTVGPFEYCTAEEVEHCKVTTPSGWLLARASIDQYQCVPASHFGDD